MGVYSVGLSFLLGVETMTLIVVIGDVDDDSVVGSRFGPTLLD